MPAREGTLAASTSMVVARTAGPLPSGHIPCLPGLWPVLGQLPAKDWSWPGSSRGLYTPEDRGWRQRTAKLTPTPRGSQQDLGSLAFTASWKTEIDNTPFICVRVLKKNCHLPASEICYVESGPTHQNVNLHTKYAPTCQNCA